ncbi:DUF6530 family protein [Paenibacillus sp. JCM 10914]|uniref:DUF6530 family protein n=1 Tax=Paenibacillus sp. JCM 10914 TaxID=1236974 RepID=UPI0003CC6086|nr:DUF6530 family protein [Paenibacillus sp. JCM 10914]GAE06449.1 hypothetical protein JCM10914_2611 [Paenibacillus sp. JCM 10914]
MKTPASTHHKPVIVSNNYEEVDGRFAGNADTTALSLGLTRGNVEEKARVSAKIWSGEEGSCSGEAEMPLHRILDLSILICSALTHFSEAYRFDHLYDPQNPVIDRIGLQGSAMTVAVCTDHDEINEDIKHFNAALNDDGEVIGERLRTLTRMLTEMGY